MSPYLFILQATPLYAMIEELKTSCAIPLIGDTTTPAGVFYADDSNLIARSPEHASRLYDAAKRYCDGSGARLNIDKCIAVPAGPAPEALPNGIKILQPGETTTILGVPFGPNITRQQQTKTIFNKMIERCAQWKYVGRTIQGRITIARTIIASTAWYILSAIDTSREEARRMQRIIEKFIHKNENIDDDNSKVKCNYSSKWLYRPKERGGCGLTPILSTIICRKVSIIRNMIVKNTDLQWTTVMRAMCYVAQQGWARSADDIKFWKGSRGKLGTNYSEWDTLTSWWHDAWSEWAKFGWKPKEQSLKLTNLTTWPVWNNRILAEGHGMKTTLRRSANGNTTPENYTKFRTLQFLTFQDFIDDEHNVLQPIALYNRVKQRIARSPVTFNDMSKRACTALSHRVATLWEAARTKWLHRATRQQPASAERCTTANWVDTHGRTIKSASNKYITKRVTERTCPANDQPPRLIKVHNNHIQLDWKREQMCYTQLAPTRRDLMFRLVRNGLPLGYKRQSWHGDYQTTCPNCSGNELETSHHLLWSCTYASQIWQMYKAP